MTSRKIDTQTNRDALFSAWSSDTQILKFTEIRDHLIEKGILGRKNKPGKHNTTVSRWLKDLVKENVLKNEEDGYCLKLNPQEFQLFDYLNYLRNSGPKIYEGMIGGTFWAASALNILGFPENSLRDEDTAIAFNLLLIRLGQIFNAVECLRNVVVFRNAGIHLSIPDPVDREVFYALLDTHVGKEGTTDKLVLRYKKNLESYYNDVVKEYWPAEYGSWAKEYFFNSKTFPRSEMSFYYYVERPTQIRDIKRNLAMYKKSLSEEGFHVDKHTLEGSQGLLKKLEIMDKKIFKKSDYFAEEIDTYNQLELAVLIKIVERLKEMKINLDDFAIILTHPPSSMDRFHTAEHVLYDAMVWTLEEPKETFLKKIWEDRKDELKSNEAMIASYLENSRFNVEEYRKLRNKPWVIKRLNKYADFNKILELYSEKDNQRREKERKFIEDVNKETKGHKPVDINEEIEKIEKEDSWDVVC